MLYLWQVIRNIFAIFVHTNSQILSLIKNQTQTVSVVGNSSYKDSGLYETILVRPVTDLQVPADPTIRPSGEGGVKTSSLMIFWNLQ